MLSKILRTNYSFRSVNRAASAAANAMSTKASLDGYGRHLFKGAVAAPYLEKQGD